MIETYAVFCWRPNVHVGIHCSLDQYVCSGAWLSGICTGTDTPADITPEKTRIQNEK